MKVLTDGDFKIHVFTGDGCFVVSSLGNPGGGGSKVSYLVVGGGGIFAPSFDSGGGGGVEDLEKVNVLVTHTASLVWLCLFRFRVSVQTCPITVGVARNESMWIWWLWRILWYKGSNSIFSTITSTGGGSVKVINPYGSGTTGTWW